MRFQFRHGIKLVECASEQGSARYGSPVLVLFATYSYSASTPAVTTASQDSVWYTSTGTLGGYASQMPASLQSAASLHTVTYYDDHSFIGHEDASVRPALGFSNVPGYGFLHTSHRGRMTGQRTYRLSGTGYTVTSLYGDARGRTVRRSSTNHLGGVETTATAYSHTGKPLMERRTHTAQGKPAVTEVTARTYDGWDRPLTVKHSVDGAAFVTVDSIAYDGIGRVASETTGGVETATYTYNVRSWPTRIAGQRFTERLCYNGPVEGLDTSRPHRYRWNGTVAAYAWKTAGETRQRGYSLLYDGLDRLTAAYYGEGAALGSYYSIYDGRAAYDDMGNPVWIYRKSPVSVSGTSKPSSPSDRLRLEYDGNRLVHVTDSVASGHSYAGAFHFADGANTDEEYEYDDNGNMTKDLNRNISSIQYNSLNLPSVIQFADNSYIEYTYGADGAKLRTQYGVQPGVGPLTPSGMGNIGYETNGTESLDSQTSLPSQEELTRVDYCGNMVYDRGERRLLFENGYVTFDITTNAPSYHFYLRDHLGNNRVVMAQNGTVEQVTHYYPFGGVMRESTNPAVQPYKYGGKELDRTSGLDTYDFGARMYFADRMQWGQMDPMSEKYYDVSPYVYCANNPLINIDSDGRDYSVCVDNDYGTILISAFFFCTLRDYERCSNDCNYWNQQSGLFSAGNYMINFMFTPIVVDNTLESYSIDNKMITQNISNLSDSQSLYNSLNSSGVVDTNTYQTVDKLDNDDFGNAKNGETRSGRIIRICSSNPLTGKHEMGHTAGLGHHPAGLMTSSSSDENRNDQIYETYIKEILKGSLPNRNGVPDAGKGHLIVNGENFDSHVFNRIRKNK